ncbi:ImmA/IrrE family metallo-endopeptidase [Globicatella sanguinis]|uniref:ImmA/IrrE family metallo-endopeptidase n=1 Tax=Globicatella sanguinis TaxID=13076 RepID=UPI0008251BEE|nr:ImmA/IrrE family metallo-endopeptidase [Globicatella sanguinis]
MKVQRVINNLLREHQTRNPEHLAEALNIEVCYLPLEVNGCFLEVNNRQFIFVADRLKYSQERFFVIAHELFHAIQHANSGELYYKAYNYHGKFEREANLFAIYLLCDLDEINEDETAYQVFKKNYIPQDMMKYVI